MKCWLVLMLAFGVYELETSPEDQAATADDSDQLIAHNRTCLITPNKWKLVTNSTGCSVISVGNPIQNQFLGVSLVARDDFEGSLLDFLNLAASEIRSHMEHSSESEPASCEVGGMQAERVRIIGSQDRFELIYTLTIAESKTAFYRILTFSRPSSERKANQFFAKVTSH